MMLIRPTRKLFPGVRYRFGKKLYTRGLEAYQDSVVRPEQTTSVWITPSLEEQEQLMNSYISKLLEELSSKHGKNSRAWSTWTNSLLNRSSDSYKVRRQLTKTMHHTKSFNGLVWPIMSCPNKQAKTLRGKTHIAHNPETVTALELCEQAMSSTMVNILELVRLSNANGGKLDQKTKQHLATINTNIATCLSTDPCELDIYRLIMDTYQYMGQDLSQWLNELENQIEKIKSTNPDETDFLTKVAGNLANLRQQVTTYIETHEEEIQVATNTIKRAENTELNKLKIENSAPQVSEASTASSNNTVKLKSALFAKITNIDWYKLIMDFYTHTQVDLPDYLNNLIKFIEDIQNNDLSSIYAKQLVDLKNTLIKTRDAAKAYTESNSTAIERAKEIVDLNKQCEDNATSEKTRTQARSRILQLEESSTQNISEIPESSATATNNTNLIYNCFVNINKLPDSTLNTQANNLQTVLLNMRDDYPFLAQPVRAYVITLETELAHLKTEYEQRTNPLFGKLKSFVLPPSKAFKARYAYTMALKQYRSIFGILNLAAQFQVLADKEQNLNTSAEQSVSTRGIASRLFQPGKAKAQQKKAAQQPKRTPHDNVDKERSRLDITRLPFFYRPDGKALETSIGEDNSSTPVIESLRQ